MHIDIHRSADSNRDL